MKKQYFKKEDFRILLINPPMYRFLGDSLIALPYGLLSIATYCEKNGFKNIGVYNADFNSKYQSNSNSEDIWKEIKEVISSFRPQVIGLSFTTPQYNSSVKLAEICKKINKKSIVIVGGSHPTIKPDETIKEKDFDILVHGEGEKTFLELVKCLVNKTPISEVKGITYKKNGKNITNPLREKIENLDELPIINRELLLDVKKYPLKELGWIIAERGCFYNCSFCAANKLWGDSVRLRNPKKIVDEIAYVNKKYKTKEFWIQSDSFTSKKSYVVEICREIKKRKLKIIWGCIARPNELDEKTLKEMKKAGCHYICMGIESGSQEILDYINKKITIKQVKKAVELIKNYNILLNLFVIIGFPQETESSLAKTKNIIKYLDPDIFILSFYTPLPGTLEYERQFKNINFGKKDWYLFDLRHANIIKRDTIDKHILIKAYNEINKMKKNNVIKHYLQNPNFMLIKLHEFISHPINIRNTLLSLKQYRRK